MQAALTMLIEEGENTIWVIIMLEYWITLIIWMEYIVPVIIIALLLGFICTVCYKDSVQQKRKIKLLLSNGFERFLKDVPAFGNGAFYAWKNERLCMCIDERDLKHMTYRELRNRIEE